MTTLLNKLDNANKALSSLKKSFCESMGIIKKWSENENIDPVTQGVCAILHGTIDALPVSSITLAKLFCDSYQVPDSLVKAFAIVEAYIDLQREYTDLHMQLLANKQIRRVK